ncbi:MAG: hypothetical protein ACFFGZ_03435 [Candidatus Thorarchaeota archaeon]
MISMIILLLIMIQPLNHNSSVVENKIRLKESFVFNQIDSDPKGEYPLAISNSPRTPKMSSQISSDHPLTNSSTQLIGQDEIMLFDWTGEEGPETLEYNGGQNNDWRDFNSESLAIGKGYKSGDFDTPYYDRRYGVFPIYYSIHDRDYACQEDQILDMQSGDIDNDGRDEIILLLMDKEPGKKAGENFGSSFLRTYDDAVEDYHLLDELEIFIDSYGRYDYSVVHLPSYLGDSINCLHRPSGGVDADYWFRNQDFAGAFALGDPDGDGVDSHIGITFHQSAWCYGNLRKNLDPAEQITFFGRWTGDKWDLYQQLDQDYYPDHGNKFTRRHYSVDCAWGNFDGDPWGKEEFVVTTLIDCRIYNINEVSPSAIDFKEYLVDTFKNDYYNPEYPGTSPVTVRLITGDFDGDKAQEIAIYTNWYYYIIESDSLNVRDPRYITALKANTGMYIHLLNKSPVYLFAIDVNRDGREEFQFCGVDTEGRGFWVCVWKDPTDNVYTIFKAYSLGDFWPRWSAAGDIDCDGQDEVIMNDRGVIKIYKVDPLGIPQLFSTYDTKNQRGPILCGNFNGNGLTLDYTGQFETIEYDPCVLAAMAAPPTQVGISQAYGNSYTSYGRSKAITTSETSSVEVKLNTQLSFTPDLPYGSSIAGNRIWEEAFKESETIMDKTIVTSFCTGGAQDNTVIYFQGSYKKYIYTITDHPFSSSSVGTYFNISTPNNPIIFTVSQTYFNRFYGEISDFVPIIANETFNHTIGHPETYPSKSDISSLTSEADLFFLSPSSYERMVGQGAQYDSLVIEMSTMHEKGFSDRVSSEWAGGLAFLGVGYGYSVGKSESEGYSIGVGDGCVFEGRVGQISDSYDYCLFRYRWGMFIHYKTHPVTGNTYLVINYYVDDAYPYYPSPTTAAASSESDRVPYAPVIFIIAGLMVCMVVKSKKRKRPMEKGSEAV